MSKLKPYTEYQNVELNFTNKLPSGWKLLRGKFVFIEVNERSVDGKEQLLSVSEHKGVVPRDSINVNMFQAENYTGYKLCNPGDVVINSLWAWHRGIGVSEHRGIVSTAYSVHRLREPEKWNHRYLTYLLRTDAYVGEYLIRSKGIWDSRLQLTGSNFQDVQVIIPPIETQNTIVEYLDRKTTQIQEFIAKKERLIELLEEQKSSNISDSIGKYRNSTLLTKLKYSIVKLGDGLHSTPEYVNTSNFHFINGNNLINGTITISESTRCVSETEYNKHRKDLNESTILYSINGTIGNIAFYNGEKVILGKSAAYINCAKNLLPEYLFYVLQSNEVKEYFNQEVTGTTIFNLGLQSLRNTPIIIPSINEQKEIVTKIEKSLSKLNNAISRAQLEIEKAKEYQESLITQVVTGQLKV